MSWTVRGSRYGTSSRPDVSNAREATMSKDKNPDVNVEVNDNRTSEPPEERIGERIAERVESDVKEAVEEGRTPVQPDDDQR
jgi:hypothetical protein